MKYKDRGFIKHQEKQRNGDYDYYANKNDRRIRREREIFYQKYLLGKVDKFWWKHLSDSDKDEIIESHRNQSMVFNMTRMQRQYYWWTVKVFDNWNDWFEYIKTTFEPNRVSLREDKLKIIGI